MVKKMKNIVMMGSPNWQDRAKIKDTIFDLKNRFGTELRIIGVGELFYSDKDIKKFALELDVEFAEIPPYYQQWTQYCIYNYNRYGKNYDLRHIFTRNALLTKHGEMLILFMDGTEEPAASVEEIISKFHDSGKPVLIIR